MINFIFDRLFLLHDPISEIRGNATRSATIYSMSWRLRDEYLIDGRTLVELIIEY